MEGPAVIHNVRTNIVSFSPIQYNPARRILKVTEEFDVTLSFDGIDTRNDIPGFPATVDPQTNAICKSLLLGYSGVYGNSNLLSDPESDLRKEYLILTAEHWTDNAKLEVYIEWLKRRGHIVATQEVQAGDVPWDIWHYIKTWYDSYAHDPAIYVLLVGDAPDSGSSPQTSTQYRIATYAEYDYEDPTDGLQKTLWSDYVYSLMTGPEWPNQGSPPPMDSVPDLAIGRWCPDEDHPEDLDHIVDKIFAYERTIADHDTWHTEDVLFVGQEESEYQDLKETIENEELYKDLDCEPIYYDAYQQGTQDIFDSLQNDQGVSMVNYAGHGFRYGWQLDVGDPEDPTTWDALFSIADIYALQNSDNYPLVFSMCCQSGCIVVAEPPEWPDPGGGSFIRHQSMVEAWTNSPDGAIGAWGASRVVHTKSDKVLDAALFDGFYLSPTSRLDVAYAINHAKMALYENPPGGYQREDIMQDIWMYYWIGDPGSRPWYDMIADQNRVTVYTDYGTFPDPNNSLPTGLPIDITVSAEWSHPEGSGWHPSVRASVGIYKPNEFNAYKSTSTSSGQASWEDVTFEQEGTFYVTVLRQTDEEAWADYLAMTPQEIEIAVGNGTYSSEVKETEESIKWSLSCAPEITSNKVLFNYSTPRIGPVSLKIYDAVGRMVKVFTREHNTPGHYQFVWNCKDLKNSNLSSGIYFYTFEGEDCQKQGKVTLLR